MRIDEDVGEHFLTTVAKRLDVKKVDVMGVKSSDGYAVIRITLARPIEGPQATTFTKNVVGCVNEMTREGYHIHDIWPLAAPPVLPTGYTPLLRNRLHDTCG